MSSAEFNTTVVPPYPEDTSRPWLQRRELGPLVHEIGHQIYDQAEPDLLADVESGAVTEPKNYDDLYDFTELCVDKLLLQVNSNDDDYMTGLSHLLNATKNIYLHGNISSHNSLTFYGDTTPVLKEGLNTGLVMPLQLYKAATVSGQAATFMTHSEWRMPYHVALSRVPFNASRAAEVINSPGFLGMLGALAQGPNGSLGSSSALVASICHDFIKPPIFPVRSFQNGQEYLEPQAWDDWRHNTFEYDEFGNPVGFTARFKQLLAESQKPGKSGVSGGCPVRYSTFRETGRIAADNFRRLGNADGLPSLQGESLIDRSARFLSTILAATVEASKAV